MKYSWITARGAKIDLDIDVKVITDGPLPQVAVHHQFPARERSRNEGRCLQAGDWSLAGERALRFLRICDGQWQKAEGIRRDPR